MMRLSGAWIISSGSSLDRCCACLFLHRATFTPS